MLATSRLSRAATQAGICALEMYIPRRFVDQSELEAYDGASAGKYTVGLGQREMAFVDDSEDITSMAMTVVAELLRNAGVNPSDVGRVEVGTETITDKSKSVKTSLMPLFGDNSEVEGIDTTNACYGGTQALLNAVNWVESASWDGRYAVVVAGDIAVYAPGPARCTGGAGVVAMLVGPDAPLALEPGLRGSHFEHAHDFYKPDLGSEYPRVDGALSNACYARALDLCQARYAARFEAAHARPLSLASDVQHAVFHQPYARLVEKSFARLVAADARRHPTLPEYAGLAPLLEKPDSDRAFATAAAAAAAPKAPTLVDPGTTVGRRVGNLYCGSLYAGLASALAFGDVRPGHRMLAFSYGSGLAATMFSLVAGRDVASVLVGSPLRDRLDAREKCSPADFAAALARREQNHAKLGFTAAWVADTGLAGRYILQAIDDLGRRTYAYQGGA